MPALTAPEGGPDMGASWYERLNPVDATFLYIESPATPMHVGGIFVYQGRPPSYREFVDHVASRLERIPRYRQRLAFVPLGLGRPVWVDDQDFDVEYHVRHARVPAPGGEEAVKRLAGRAFGRALDRGRPLWELELVEGVSDDRFVVLSKTHHCLLDGIAGNGVIAEITDSDPGIRNPGPPPRFSPRPAPGPAELMAQGLRDQLARPLALARGALAPATEGRGMLLDLRDGIGPLAALAWGGRAPETSLNGPVGPRRRYEMLSLDLEAVRRIRTALGATVNDVLLAIVAGALGKLLDARREPRRDDLRAFVPVNVRPPGTQGATGNQVAAVYCPLPVAERDPVARVRKVSAAMKALKQGKQALAALSIAHLEELVPPPVVAPLARLEIAYRRFNLVVSNVPGSQTPRYMLGRRLLTFHPLIPLAARQTISVGLHTYAETIGFGLLADADRARDLPLFARAISDGLAELAAATEAGAAVDAPPLLAAHLPQPGLLEESGAPAPARAATVR
jgi:WS/DGAT/MGAT family acyltransferase